YASLMEGSHNRQSRQITLRQYTCNCHLYTDHEATHYLQFYWNYTQKSDIRKRYVDDKYYITTIVLYAASRWYIFLSYCESNRPYIIREMPALTAANPA